jgi:hypothetical protein
VRLQPGSSRLYPIEAPVALSTWKPLRGRLVRHVADGPFEARSAVTGPSTRIWAGGAIVG